MLLLLLTPVTNVALQCMMSTTENQASKYMHVLNVATDCTFITQDVSVVMMLPLGKLTI
jgi:hypothetical protein